MSLFATRQCGWKMVQDISSCVNRYRRINEANVPTFLLCGFQTPWFLYFCMQRNDWVNPSPLNIPYFIFSVHSLQLTLSWPNKQFNCMLTTDSCTFICWNQTGLIYAWPIALSRFIFIIFKRKEQNQRKRNWGAICRTLQSIFVVSKFGIYLLDPSHMIKRNVYHV